MCAPLHANDLHGFVFFLSLLNYKFGENGPMTLTGLPWELNEVMKLKCLTHQLARVKHAMNITCYVWQTPGGKKGSVFKLYVLQLVQIHDITP